jgi:hypothetical protein
MFVREGVRESVCVRARERVYVQECFEELQWISPGAAGDEHNDLQLRLRLARI